MTVVNGTITDTAGTPMDGVLSARVSMFRPDGSMMLAPESVPYPIEDGHVTADLTPGPARLSIQTSGPARHFTVTIPDEGPVTLASLIGDS